MTAREDLQVGVRGWIEAKLINREGKVVHEHTQSNLILNRGLDFIMSSLLAHNMHLYIAVGTGSTQPAPTQTALANEIARTNQTLGLGSDLDIVVLGDGYYRISRTRGFDYNQANGNLTEFGGSDSSSSSAGVNTRELFRDSNGNPIVITKTSNERLAITYHLEVKFNPVVATDYGTVNILDGSGNIVGSRLVRHLFTRPLSSSNIRTIDLTLISAGAYRSTSGDISISGANSHGRTDLLTTQVNLNYTADQVLGGASSINSSWSTYTAGAFYRELSHELGPEASDRTIYGYIQGVVIVVNAGTTYSGRSYAAAFVNADGTPNPFVKNKDYRFRVATRFTISRL